VTARTFAEVTDLLGHVVRVIKTVDVVRLSIQEQTAQRCDCEFPVLAADLDEVQAQAIYRGLLTARMSDRIE
jgi:hypothetical protein